MEINLEKELQTLQSEYATFKKGLEKQDALNEKFFQSLRKRPASAIAKEVRNRMLGDALTVPAILIICLHTDWPILFGVLVSLWALADLGICLWVSRKLGMNHLLDGDVRTVTAKIAGYRKFYTGSLLVGIVPLAAMLAYMFMHLYARADSPATAQLITASLIASIVAGLAVTLFQYRKHTERCKELLEQFEEQ